MKTDNYIIVASDDSTTLSKIVNELDNLYDYSNVTVNSVKLLKQLLTSIQPKLIVFNFKNNELKLKMLMDSYSGSLPPVLCLTNRYEKFHFIPKNILLIAHSLESSLQNSYLLTNVKSILALVKTEELTFDKSIPQRKESSFATENKNLARYVLELDQKKALLKSMMDRMKALSSSVDEITRTRLNSIINNIKLNTNTNHWDDFKVYFENINPKFIKELSNKYPCLTVKDIKYCCYLKMNMSNEDIRYILGISKESVRTHKYRLKKKMILEKEQDLKSYISSF